MSGWREEQIGPHRLILGDCIDILPTIERVHSVVTDPPYAINFMQKSWDNGSVAFSPEFWARVCNKLRPGGFVAAFGGDRTFHRLYCAIEDGGFEPRHTVAWIYSTGFPKSLNVSKRIEEQHGWCDCDG